MPKRLILSLVLLFTIFLFNPFIQKGEASELLYDSFQNGYSQSLWNQLPNTLAPLVSPFGIKGLNDGNNYSIATINLPIPANNVIKFQVKINTNPSSFVFTCRETADHQNSALSYFFGDGNLSIQTFTGGGGHASPNYPWNNSIGIHTIEMDCIGSTVKVFEDNQILYDSTLQNDNYQNFPSDLVSIYFRSGDSEFANYQLCDENGCPSTSTYPQLNVPLVKQNDINWGLQLYDSANKWSPKHETIDEWGCALTSAVMILQYYNITKLPDGSELNPGTLNTWLKSQPDGYIGSGLVNWLALSRLTKLQQTKLENPNFHYDALEYRRSNFADTATLVQDLTNNQPDILEEPGHFIVGTGQNVNTFLINDPFFDRSFLTDGYHNTFLSLGRFVPSHTDLSYILMTSDPTTTVTLTQNGQQVGESYIQNPLTAAITPNLTSGQPIRITYLTQPSDETYLATISAPTTQQYNIHGFFYDTDGNSYPFNQQGFVGPNQPDEFSFQFSSESGTLSQSIKVVTLDTVLGDITNAISLHLLPKGIGQTLINILQPANETNEHHPYTLTLSDIQRAEHMLFVTKQVINQSAFDILNEDLQLLEGTL